MRPLKCCDWRAKHSPCSWSFLTLLKADRDVAKAVSAAELEALFDLGYHLKHVDTIFGRVFGG